MSRSSTNGQGRPSIRFDQRPGGLPSMLGRGVSGRVFVIGALLGLLLCWGALYLAFVGWRTGARERIAFGKEHVVPVVRPLAGIDPPSVAPEDWRQAVEDSEAMLEEVVGTGRLDRAALVALRSDLARRVAIARRSPEAAPEILAVIWDDMARIKRLREGTDRPPVLPPAARGPVPGRSTQ